jgi:Tfp pilus assembly PilM family ATPase
MEYHESHLPHQHLGQEQKKIKKIILCGGGANLQGLPDFLTKALKAEVAVGNPWVNILSSDSKEIPALSFQDSLGYTTALGLALRGIRGGQ